MNRVCEIAGGIRIPDDTVIRPFLNSKDITSDLPWDLVEGFSIAAGDIEPNTASMIYVMPVVTQVIFVLCGWFFGWLPERTWVAAPYPEPAIR